MTPEVSIGAHRMGRRQWIAIAIGIFLNGLDGFDAASISFAAADLSRDWQLSPNALGWVLSMELIGMAAGSMIFGLLADLRGRRICILLCLGLMTTGMLAAAYAGSVVELSLARIVAGLGIGGMLAALTALVSEYANDRWRALVVSTMIIGYPVGTVLGGLVARQLLADGDWRSVFLFGAGMTLAALPCALAFLPESPIWLGRSNKLGAAERANAILLLFGLPPARTFPPTADRVAFPFAALFQSDLARTTILLTAAYAGHMACYYFVFKWLPKLVVDMGHHPQAGADILIVAMLAGAAAGPIFGLVSSRLTLHRTAIGVLVGGAVAVNVFGQIGASFLALAFAAVLLGGFLNGGGVAFYALLAAAFPAHLRGSGLGFGLGVGRAGAAFGPAISGWMFGSGQTLPATAAIMSLGPVMAAIAIIASNKSRLKQSTTRA